MMAKAPEWPPFSLARHLFQRRARRTPRQTMSRFTPPPPASALSHRASVPDEGADQVRVLDAFGTFHAGGHINRARA